MEPLELSDGWSSVPWSNEPLWRYGVAWRIDLVAAPTAEPIQLADAVDHLNALGTDKNAYINRLITVTRRVGEYSTRRAWMPQVWKLVMDRFPRSRLGGGGVLRSAVIRVPNPPIISIDSINYLDENNTPQTVDSSIYETDLPVGPHAGYGRIRPVRGQTWPRTAHHTFDAVTITFHCGYALAGSPPSPTVPEDLIHGQLLMIGELFKTRSESVPSGKTAAMITARNLWMPYRVY